MEARPTPVASSAPASSKPEEGPHRDGEAGIVVATSSHLYRITPDGQAQEYTGKAGVWTIVRKGTERIFTSPTTLYATDGKTGNIEQYDRAKKSWTVIGAPVDSFVSTKDRLYAVNADRSNVYEYAAASETWSPIGSPRH
ncbi:hypothetical protein ACIQ8D_30135 [Streptomyces sp. NPDC096094]|uniref:hypothetical protein n=1 Tax=Streptomyces sp. NPDC096094 TaxID=3366073 RepID=UPI00380E284D